MIVDNVMTGSRMPASVGRIRRLLLIAPVAALPLGGCERGPRAPDMRWSDLVSAELIEHAQGGAVIGQSSLQEGRIQAVADWFRTREQGWAVDDSVYEPALSLRLTYADGTAVVANLAGSELTLFGLEGQFRRTLDAAGRDAFLAAVGR